jgi:hypothetical protein
VQVDRASDAARSTRPRRTAQPARRDALEKLRLAEAKYEWCSPPRGDAKVRAERTAPNTPPVREAEGGGPEGPSFRSQRGNTRRRLIDQALVPAGWNVGPAMNTEQVRQRYGSGCRRQLAIVADCVLYGDEAPRCHRGEEDAKTHAWVVSRPHVCQCLKGRRASGHLLHERCRRFPVG